MMGFVLSYEATPAVHEAIRALGRTEDLRFSPGKTKLAVSAFEKSKIFVFSINIESSPAGPRISMVDYLVVSSASLLHPHGISFIDEDTIVVANRLRYVSIFKLPVLGGLQKEFDLRPVRTLWRNALRKLDSPGSVEVYQTGVDESRMLICNNYAHVVTSAKVNPGKNYRIRKHRTLLKKSLEIPDGISVSPDRKWIAVSNHSPGTVFIYENTPALNQQSEPAATLHGMDCPHGIRFTGDGQMIIVADAARHYMYVFANDKEGWSGDYQPYGSVRVLDDETFQRGRYNVEEGGPKGIDLDTTSNVLAITCEHMPLAFYHLDGMLQSLSSAPQGTGAGSGLRRISATLDQV